jgi:hypothetical protein
MPGYQRIEQQIEQRIEQNEEYLCFYADCLQWKPGQGLSSQPGLRNHFDRNHSNRKIPEGDWLPSPRPVRLVLLFRISSRYSFWRSIVKIQQSQSSRQIHLLHLPHSSPSYLWWLLCNLSNWFNNYDRLAPMHCAWAFLSREPCWSGPARPCGDIVYNGNNKIDCILCRKHWYDLFLGNWLKYTT